MIRTLTCRQVIAVLMDYVDGTLAASTRRGVEDHLKTCAPCRDFERAYRATPGVVRRATGAATGGVEPAATLRAGAQAPAASIVTTSAPGHACSLDVVEIVTTWIPWACATSRPI